MDHLVANSDDVLVSDSSSVCLLQFLTALCFFYCSISQFFFSSIAACDISSFLLLQFVTYLTMLFATLAFLSYIIYSQHPCSNSPLSQTNETKPGI
jgi:hypothetical protein